MIRKILAVLVTIITIYCLKETYVIFTSSATEIVQHRKQLIIISLSILLPLMLLSFYLWRPKPTPNP